MKLLIDSLPEGAQIAGEAEVPAALSRDALTAEISFVVSVQKRPEIRKVFPPRGGAGASATAKPGARPSPPASGRPGPGPRANRVAESISHVAPAVERESAFAIQIAALSDPVRARDVVRLLKAAGLPAYLVTPASGESDGPYRVRIGPYLTRAAAQKTAAALEKSRGEKLWVTKE